MVTSSWFSYQSWLGSLSGVALGRPDLPNENSNRPKISKDSRSLPRDVSVGATSKLESDCSPQADQASCNLTTTSYYTSSCSSSSYDSSSNQSPPVLPLPSEKVASTGKVEERRSKNCTKGLSRSNPPQVATSRNGWIDVDHENVDDPQACSTYSSTIFKNMRVSELTRRASPKAFQQLQGEVNFMRRALLVNWLVEVTGEYKLCADTLFQCINYVDRFLSLRAITRDELQLVGVTCMWIAAKYEEIYPPTLEEFCHVAVNVYSKDQVIKMERLVLQKLDFELTDPTPKLFLRRLLQVCNPDERLHFLSNYLTEVSLLDINMHEFLPSEIAAAAVLVANFCLGREPWDANLQHHAMYSSDQILRCANALKGVLEGPGSDPHLEAIFNKYGQTHFFSVSRLAPVVNMMYSLRC
eukprot:gene9939-7809_t